MPRTVLIVPTVLAALGFAALTLASDESLLSDVPELKTAQEEILRTTSDGTGEGAGRARVTIVAASAVKEPVSSMLGSPECDGCNKSIDRCLCDSYAWRFFGQWMLLQPRGSDLVYAESALSCLEPTLGSEQIDYGFYSGLKVGFARSLHDGCSELAASYSYFRADENDSVIAAAGTVLRPTLTLVPSCDNLTSLFAAASTDVQFDRVDIDYRKFYTYGCTQLDCSIGFGFGHLSQQLNAEYGSSSAAIDDLVESDLDLFGYGVRLGGGAQRTFWNRVSTFGHADLTLLASNVKVHYQQQNLTGPDSGEFSQDSDRIVPVVDLELGLALDLWKHSAVKVGYTYSIWFNVPTTEEIVQSVQAGDLNDDVHDDLSFDGLFVRFEWLW